MKRILIMVAAILIAQCGFARKRTVVLNPKIGVIKAQTEVKVEADVAEEADIVRIIPGDGVECVNVRLKDTRGNAFYQIKLRQSDEGFLFQMPELTEPALMDIRDSKGFVYTDIVLD